MHLDRRNRVLVDQGDGHGLILVHRTSSAFAETLSWPGRRVETTASRLLPMKRAFKRRLENTLLQGEKVAKDVEGWSKVIETLTPPVATILDYLRQSLLREEEGIEYVADPRAHGVFGLMMADG